MSGRYSSKFRSVFSYALVLAIVVQPLAASANTSSTCANVTRSKTVCADIELKREGVLVGQIVNAAGVGLSNESVKLTRSREIFEAQTDEKGWFRFKELRGGVYQIHTAGHTQSVRLWSNGTAPPRASQGLLITPPAEVFRGQRVLSPNTNQFFRVAKQRLANPLVVTGTILTAVAIPVAIHNSDDDPPATP